MSKVKENVQAMIKKRLRLVICAVCIVFILCGKWYIDGKAADMPMQNPAKRWSGEGTDNGYAAVFFPKSEGITEDAVREYRGTYEEALREDGIEKEDGKKVYNEAYSCEGEISVFNKNAKNETSVNVTAVGGDYFFFHPMKLLSGGYIYPDDLMHDRVVIDENAAWSLYGSVDIDGKMCIINNKHFYIAGVVKKEESNIKDAVYGEKSRLYMHFDEYAKIKENAVVTSYELVYPETFTGRAKRVLQKLLGESGMENAEGNEAAGEKAYDIVDMDKRFNIPALWNRVSKLAKNRIQTKEIMYPMWENECRMLEWYADIAFVWCLVWTVVFVILIIPQIGKIYRKTVGTAENICKKIVQKISGK